MPEVFLSFKLIILFHIVKLKTPDKYPEFFKGDQI